MDHSVLGDIPVLAGFSDDELRAFGDACEPREVPAGHPFFKMGDLNRSLYVIRSGSVRVERIGVEGDVPVVKLAAGDTFGEMSFLDGSATTASVTSDTPTELLVIDREELDLLLGMHPALWGKFWYNLAVELKRRLARTNELVDHYMDLNQVLLENPAYKDAHGRI